MIQVIPGILEKNFDDIIHRIRLVENLVDWVQIDVLDNTLIQNTTYNQWSAFRIYKNKINLEAHLMVANPENYVQPLVKNGFKRLIAHVEAASIRDFIERARSFEVEVGVALDGPSPVEMIEPYLDEVDVVLLMMYKAGMSGQEFQPQNLPKIKQIHEQYVDLPIEVDGGIDKKTAPLMVENGAQRLVVTSYLFNKNQHRIEEAIRDLIKCNEV